MISFWVTWEVVWFYFDIFLLLILLCLLPHFLLHSRRNLLEASKASQARPRPVQQAQTSFFFSTSLLFLLLHLLSSFFFLLRSTVQYCTVLPPPLPPSPSPLGMPAEGEGGWGSRSPSPLSSSKVEELLKKFWNLDLFYTLQSRSTQEVEWFYWSKITQPLLRSEQPDRLYSVDLLSRV